MKKNYKTRGTRIDLEGNNVALCDCSERAEEFMTAANAHDDLVEELVKLRGEKQAAVKEIKRLFEVNAGLVADNNDAAKVLRDADVVRDRLVDALKLAHQTLGELDGKDTATECVTIHVADEIEAIEAALAAAGAN